MTVLRLSPILIQDGFAWGWAHGPAGPIGVHLWMDGRHIATEFTGLELPAHCIRFCGQPPAPQSGFMFALPAAALDGFAHDLHVGLPASAGDGLHGEVQTWQSSHVRGEVRQHGRNFIGTVWFDARPRAPRLEVVDDAGRVLLRHALTPGATPERHGLPAAFSIPCDSLPVGPLHFRCAGQALRGSPCSRRVSVVGMLEDVSTSGIRGWAFDGADPGNPLELCLRIDGRVTAWFRPNALRTEISARLGQSAGLIGFHLPLPEGMIDGRQHRVEVTAADDGQLLTQGQRMVRFDRAWVPATAGTSRRAPPRPAKLRQASAQPPEVSVIILTRNGEGVLTGLLESWARHNTSVPTELIVVDHASQDDTLALLARWEQHLPLRTIALDHNASFSASCNRGARMARGKYLLFLNNDIVWLHDALPRMIESLQHPDVGIVGMKLVKEVGESRHALQPANEVQHLGVRFKLNDRGYWPFEVAPSPLRADNEHSPQVVPAVTGAALLCRKSDFDSVGGFDESYFYGFEDVELCLRLSYRLRKLTVCRNDASALHRHGHTRLSGRDLSIYDRVQRNSKVLATHIGIWAKQAYWRSLLQGDGFITNEPLFIGIVIDGPQAHAPLASDAKALAAQLQGDFPHAQIVYLPPGLDWKNAADLHVLIVGTPDYDIRALTHARADFLTLAWVRSQPEHWAALAWWTQFGGSFGSGQAVARLPGALLSTERWRLRVAIHVPLAQDQLPGATPAARHAQALHRSLQQAGLPCWMVPLEQWATHPAMADVCITIVTTAADAPPPTLRADVLNVRWLPQPGAIAPPPGDVPCITTRSQPDAAWLHQAMEEQVGSTFRPS